MIGQKSLCVWLAGLALATSVFADDGVAKPKEKASFKPQKPSAPEVAAPKSPQPVPLSRQRRERRKQWEQALQSPVGLPSQVSITLGELLDQIREKHGLNVQVDLPHVSPMVKAFESGGSSSYTAGVTALVPFGVHYHQTEVPVGALGGGTAVPWSAAAPAAEVRESYSGTPYPGTPATQLTPVAVPGIAPAASAAPPYATQPVDTSSLEETQPFESQPPVLVDSIDQTDLTISDLGSKLTQARKRQAEARDDSVRDIQDMRGSRPAWDPLIQQTISKLLDRHESEPDDARSSKKRVCFVGLENKGSEELGELGEQIYERIDATISESKDFEVINRRFVQAGLRKSGLRIDDLHLPRNAQAFSASLKNMEQPIDCLLFAKITSGTTRSSNEIRRDHLLTLELVDLDSGQVTKESAELRESYHKLELARQKQPKARKSKPNPKGEPETKPEAPSDEPNHPFAEVLKSILDAPIDPAVLAQPNVTVEDVLRQSFDRALPMQAMINAELADEMPLLASLTKAAEWDLLVQDNGVLVTTRLNANLQKETRVYSIHALEQTSKLKAEDVARVLTRTVRPWSWKQYYPEAKSTDSAPAGKKGSGSTKKVSIPRINLDLLSLLLSSNARLPGTHRIRLTSDDDSAEEATSSSSDKVELTEDDLEMLGRAWENLFLATVTSIQVIYHSDPPTGVVEVLPGMLIISQSQGAHREIADLLEQLAHPDN